jgi:hypothetical protein
MRSWLTTVVVLVSTVLGAAGAGAQTADAAENALAIFAPLHDGEDGVNCRYFNVGASVPWRRPGGDWIDRRGALHGGDAQARERIAAENRVRAIQVDVSDLVAKALEDPRRQLELMLREVSARSGGTLHFFSRESAPEQRPGLLIHFTDGDTARIVASADAQISCSTYRTLGTGDWLTVGPQFNTAIAFNLKEVPAKPIKRASLSLMSRDRQYGEVTLGVFELANPFRVGATRAEPAAAGLADRYPGDKGLAGDPAVMLFEDFESSDWRSRWSEAGGDIAMMSGAGFGFEPVAGQALRVRIAEGRDYGASLRFRFSDKMGREPEQAYFRYMLRFGEDWLPIPDGGKLPGFAATYGRAGWGGRQADGSNGWSARGSFNAASQPSNPLHGLTTIGFYAYHADMPTRHGEIWPWTERTPVLLANNRWYAIEQHVKLNTPGKNNGVLRAWVDGRLVFERTDLRFRDTAELRIEELWMNVYFGGTRPSSRNMHLFIDNVVVADRYIGPMAGRAVGPTATAQ